MRHLEVGLLSFLKKPHDDTFVVFLKDPAHLPGEEGGDEPGKTTTTTTFRCPV